MPFDSHPPAPPEIVLATVHAGGEEMHYGRLGTGPSLLLVMPEAADSGYRARLVEALSKRFRVYVPPSPGCGEGGAPAALLLQRFLDGLGLERVCVVADASCAAEVLWLAQTDPERIERVALVLPEAADPTIPATLPVLGNEPNGSAMLLVRLGFPRASAPTHRTEYALHRMINYLAGGG
jgi:pimeloyl-ACP methyl ester carboxylesterase